MDFSLVMKLTDGTERRFPLNKTRTLIGRETRCHVRIALPNVAEKHCEIVLDNGELQLSDLGSELGTLVNGSPVQKTVLDHADELTVGPVTFHVQRNQIAEANHPADQPASEEIAFAESDHDTTDARAAAHAEIEINAKSTDPLVSKSRAGGVSRGASSRRNRR